MKFYQPISLLITLITIPSLNARNIIGYVTEWNGVPQSSSDYTKMTHINYSFALFDNKDYNPKVTDESLLSKVVSEAHKVNTKVLVSVGGWTGSKAFSPMVANPENRRKFIQNIENMVNKFQLDGIDLDWEYPGEEADGNQFDAQNDAKNFLEFLKELKSKLNGKLLTAAVGVKPFKGSDGLNFGQVFDFINIMSYDINMTSMGTAGSLAPFEANNGFSFKSSIEVWKKYGFQSNQINMGLPFYGNIGVSEASSIDSVLGSKVTQGKPIKYSEIVEKALPNYSKNGSPFQYKVDPVGKTPYLFNPSTKEYITYDDETSLLNKVKYVACNNLGGVMFWEYAQDYHTKLLDSIQAVKDKECSAIQVDQPQQVQEPPKKEEQQVQEPPKKEEQQVQEPPKKEEQQVQEPPKKQEQQVQEPPKKEEFKQPEPIPITEVDSKPKEVPSSVPIVIDPSKQLDSNPTYNEQQKKEPQGVVEEVQKQKVDAPLPIEQEQKPTSTPIAINEPKQPGTQVPKQNNQFDDGFYHPSNQYDDGMYHPSKQFDDGTWTVNKYDHQQQ